MSSALPGSLCFLSRIIMRSALLYCFLFMLCTTEDLLCAPRYCTVFFGFMRCALLYCVLLRFNSFCATVLFSFGIYALSVTLLCSFGIYALSATLLCSFGIYALSATLLFEPFPSRNLSSEFRILMFWAHDLEILKCTLLSFLLRVVLAQGTPPGEE